jgi:hypothetical protein
MGVVNHLPVSKCANGSRDGRKSGGGNGRIQSKVARLKERAVLNLWADHVIGVVNAHRKARRPHAEASVAEGRRAGAQEYRTASRWGVGTQNLRPYRPNKWPATPEGDGPDVEIAISVTVITGAL